MLAKEHQFAAACDQWLRAWELAKQMATPEMTKLDDFREAHGGLTEFPLNWCGDLEMTLYDVGFENPVYWEHRLRYAREFVQQFPNEDTLNYLNFKRAEGEALWRLGRVEESEACYADLVQKLPDEAWAYIGWADGYWLFTDSAKDYEKGEAIMKRALDRPDLHDRNDVLDRLADLYQEWEKPQQLAEVEAELAAIVSAEAERKAAAEAATQELEQAIEGTWSVAESLGFKPLQPGEISGYVPYQAPDRPGRNDPCWCGSGKKYKHCHWRSDHQR